MPPAFECPVRSPREDPGAKVSWKHTPCCWFQTEKLLKTLRGIDPRLKLCNSPRDKPQKLKRKRTQEIHEMYGSIHVDVSFGRALHVNVVSLAGRLKLRKAHHELQLP